MKIKSAHNKLTRLYKKLESDDLTDSVVKTWTELPDRPVVSNFIIEKVRSFQIVLKTQCLTPSENQEDKVDSCELGNFEKGICNALMILNEFNDSKAVPAVIELLETCLDCKFRIVFTYCIDTLIKLGKERLELLIDKYYEYESFPDKQGVWVEILAKLNIHDVRIREVIENHLKINSCEAILAIGDYKDKYFAPILREIVEKAAFSLRNKNLNPFQKMVRAWNSDADIYIETRSVLVELEYDVKAGSGDYKKLVYELDAEMLPHIDSIEKFRRIQTDKPDTKSDSHPENDSSTENIEPDKVLYLEWCLEKALHDLQNIYDISFIVGFFKGLTCLGIELDVSDCVRKLFDGKIDLEDTDHYNHIFEIFNLVYSYYSHCFDRGEVGNRLYGFQKMETDTLDKGICLCREISGFIEGIRIGFENYCEAEINLHLCNHLTKLHDLITVFIERKYKISNGASQINDHQNITEFDKVFSDLILTIACQFRQEKRIAGLKTTI